ncbi:MAG: DUF736 family protein [Rhodobacteraceae bacterium]|nr:DUF736 family protein [Paracoccaceae bacterium]
MSKKIGTLIETASKTTGEVGYMGEIDVAGIKGRCALRPISEKRKETSPDYELLIERGGRFVNFGVAWIKSPQAGGEDFLSIIVDHELLQDAVSCAAFPPSEDADGKEWAIVWGRARGGKSRAAAEAVVDEIPY